MRVGLGFDSHLLVEGRALILGGLNIPYPRGLQGVSDGDVILHSVADAILGALGKGDIGDYFPSEDKSSKGISSRIILKKVLKILREERYKINNLDITLILEEPRLKPFKSKLVKNLSLLLGLSESNLSLKIKSLEGLAFKEGCILCLTVVLIDKTERVKY